MKTLRLKATTKDVLEGVKYRSHKCIRDLTETKYNQVVIGEKTFGG